VEQAGQAWNKQYRTMANENNTINSVSFGRGMPPLEYVIYHVFSLSIPPYFIAPLTKSEMGTSVHACNQEHFKPGTEAKYVEIPLLCPLIGGPLFVKKCVTPDTVV
jgi:hypothetical protein